MSPHDGVLLLPGGELDFPTRCLAAEMAVGGLVGIGRWSALHLHGLLRTTPTHVDLVVAADRRAPALERVRPWRSRTLEQEDIIVRAGIPLTTPERTYIDLAAVMELRSLRSRILAGFQRGLGTPDSVWDRLTRMGPVPGRPKLVSILDGYAREQPDSGFEHDVRGLLRRNRLVPFPRPFPFRCPDGVVVHLDVALPAWWITLECDHIRYHSSETQFATDRLRWSQIQLGGWRIVWVSDERLRSDPDGIIAEVRAHIALADPNREPPHPAD